MNSSPADALIFVGGLTLITLAIFGGLLGGIRKQGGKVRTDLFALPELLMSIVLVGFFAALIVKGAARAGDELAPKVTIDQVVPGTLPFVILAAGLAAFVRFRGIKLWNALGFDRVSVPRALAISVGLLLAALPLLLVASMIMQIVLRQSAHEQDLVTLFRDVARTGNQAGVMTILVAGAVVAPICEEFLFRGFFYSVFKRYLGPVAAALLTAALFAGVHLNLAAMPSLFLLALCFTVAYESTGSLLVPMTMHALFNASQLVLLYLLARPPAT
jgi:membrane protease YdiL (CAAX protease family)